MCLVFKIQINLYDIRMNTHTENISFDNKKEIKCILTERELEYLSLLAMGYKNQEIADILVVNLCTVKKTLEKVFRKLNAKDRANAVALAFIHCILNLEVLHNITTKYSLQNLV